MSLTSAHACKAPLHSAAPFGKASCVAIISLCLMVPNHIRPENHGRKDSKRNTLKAGPTLSAPWLDMKYHQSLFNLTYQSQMSSQSKLTTCQAIHCSKNPCRIFVRVHLLATARRHLRGFVPRVDFSILCFELQEDRHLDKLDIDMLKLDNKAPLDPAMWWQGA